MEIKVAQVINHNQVKKDQAVQLEDGRIQNIRNLYPFETPEFPNMIPGFIDIHTHGRMGFSTMDIENYEKLSKSYLISGTTAFVASILTAPIEEIEKILQFGKDYIRKNREQAADGYCALLHGFHLEGPYLSVINCGAQHPELIIPFDEKGKTLIDTYHEILDMITLDYQDPSATELVRVARQYPIILSAGHDSAVGERVYEGIAEGISHVTHIFSSTSSFFKGVRNGVFAKLLGTQEIALMTHGVSVEVITDGHHITKSIFDFIKHCKPIDEIITVSDSTEYSGLPYESGKRCKLGKVDIMLEEGVAMLPDRSTLAGSIISMHDAFRILVNTWGEDRSTAVALTSYNPARKLGIDDLGVIQKGAQADILLMDDSSNLLKIYKHGVVFNSTD